MADEDDENTSDSSKSVESVRYDPYLDFYSDKFDPLLALNTPNLKPPNSSAKLYDNLALFESAAKKEKNPQQGQSSKKKQAMEVEVKRKWLPHQLPVQSNYVFTKKNLFTKMEAAKGPMTLLKRCREERLQIKVWTRHQKGIRGYCIGYITAFDKHWNLALEEVFEFWTRPKKRRIPALDSAEFNEGPNRRVWPPKIKVTPHETNKNLENCTRNVRHLLMRGEHIVFINIIDGQSSST